MQLDTIRTKRLLLIVMMCSSVFIADRATKELSRHFMMGKPASQAVAIMPGLLYISHSENDAGFMGFMTGLPAKAKPLFFSLSTLAFSALLVYLIIRFNANQSSSISTALSLILAGIISNGFDRIAYGAVIDCAVVARPFAFGFNIADIAIFAGWVMFVFYLFKARCDTR